MEAAGPLKLTHQRRFEMSEEIIKYPCPFCGETDALKVMQDDDLRCVYTYCESCECTGPIVFVGSDIFRNRDVSAAIQAWNQRSTPATEE